MARFWKVTLTEIPTEEEALLHAYGRLSGSMKQMKAIRQGKLTLHDRLPEGKCTECGNDEWLILPILPSTKDGGKPYIECVHCGHITHL